ncbi:MULTISPECIES: hypothetical protein [unclassified Roseateles]|uniref:hypothetical protein n=1 Tax=unclassified Roseateles TaxID=2626991 RepID=UPI0022B8BFE1|nr:MULTISPECIES: hypothetical protein [unclassified Roseateles]MCZ7884261.1 hypothetical protein [Paucibacter sp. M5-1]MDC6170552.1 hypothetical protein [Paucibacter sp. XJ19-41]
MQLKISNELFAGGIGAAIALLLHILLRKEILPSWFYYIDFIPLAIGLTMGIPLGMAKFKNLPLPSPYFEIFSFCVGWGFVMGIFIR